MNGEKEFMQAQIRAIEKAKWKASEEAGYDLGNQFCLKWIELNAESFRKEWSCHHK